MVVTIEYRRVVRVQPYEPVTIGMREDFEGAKLDYDGWFQGLKAQVDKWCDEAREEFSGDERPE